MLQPIQMATLRSPIQRIELGGSHVIFVGRVETASRGLVDAVLKVVPNYELVREVLCALLAQAIDLPVCAPMVVLAPANTRATGTSEFLFGTPLNQSARKFADTDDAWARILAWPFVKRAMAFDEWSANPDRHPKNFLFESARGLRLIDHGEALRLGTLPGTSVRNVVADRALSELHKTQREALGAQIKFECASFSSVQSYQILAAGHVDAWGGREMMSECLRLLHDRLVELPTLIDRRVGSDQIPLWTSR